VDPDKSFAPCTSGVVFGVQYNTQAWTWLIPTEKRARLLTAVKAAIEADSISAREAKSLVGKLIHIKALLPAAKFNINHIMQLAAGDNVDLDRTRMDITAECRRQLWHWFLLLQSCPGWMSIPSPAPPMQWAKQLFTDAAGGSTDRVGAGTGGVCDSWWFYVPWPKHVNAGGWRVDRKKVGRKLSALELIGPLIAIAAGAQEFANTHVTCWVDNAGSVAIWNKGYSTKCRLSSTIVTSINAIAAAIGCTFHIQKITRCSNAAAATADALSKAQFALARQYSPFLNVAPAAIPASLVQWVDRPNPTDDLAHLVLTEISKNMPVLNYSV
jgi:hypothetical protein